MVADLSYDIHFIGLLEGGLPLTLTADEHYSTVVRLIKPNKLVPQLAYFKQKTLRLYFKFLKI